MREWMVTPSVIVDETRVRRNVQRMQDLANAHNVQLRPHVKTHKTVEIAALQLAAGASGITVAKPAEALKFLHSGLASLKSILVAYPVVQTAKVSKLLVAAQQFNMEVRITVDSVNGLDAVEKAANSCDYQVKVLLHIDVGYHRVGLEEGDARILEFARRIVKAPNLEFAGLLSHAGASCASCATVAVGSSAHLDARCGYGHTEQDMRTRASRSTSAQRSPRRSGASSCASKARSKRYVAIAR